MAPDEEHASSALAPRPALRITGRFGDLFTPRQLVALSTLGDLFAEALDRTSATLVAVPPPMGPLPLLAFRVAYADAVVTYLALGSTE